MIDDETATRILMQACYKALANLRKPDADPRTIASALRQQFELIELELTERVCDPIPS